jgi:hypothetical protein
MHGTSAERPYVCRLEAGSIEFVGNQPRLSLSDVNLMIVTRPGVRSAFTVLDTILIIYVHNVRIERTAGHFANFIEFAGLDQNLKFGPIPELSVSVFPDITLIYATTDSGPREVKAGLESSLIPAPVPQGESPHVPIVLIDIRVADHRAFVPPDWSYFSNCTLVTISHTYLVYDSPAQLRFTVRRKRTVLISGSQYEPLVAYYTEGGVDMAMIDPTVFCWMPIGFELTRVVGLSRNQQIRAVFKRIWRDAGLMD